jgi:Spy/CpxP family protein refolding chaperone
MKTYAAIGLLLAAWGAPLQGQTQGGFEQFLFPPELVMQHQRAIDLTSDQRSIITQAITALQNRVVELQWEMQSETEGLAELLSGETVDRDKAVDQIDRVLDIERQVKRAHLTALVEIKNALTPEQQRQLRELDRRDEGSEPRREGAERRRPLGDPERQEVNHETS